MDDSILIAKGSILTRIPRTDFESELAGEPERMRTRLAFMTETHHRIRYYVVRQLPVSGAAIAPEQIARALGIPLPEVDSILDELHRNLFFLVRDHQGNVVWAFPVTAEPTPHRLKFSTGAEIYAA